MTDDDLKSAIMAEVRDSIGYMGEGSDISNDRATAMARYMGQPYGDERDGRSQVVSRDVMDTVEWILPSLLRIFCSGDDVARYEANGPHGEAFAKEATDYINHVFMKKNAGFLVFLTWFKDALIQKNGVVKYWYEKETKQKVASYDGLDDMQFWNLVGDKNVKVLNYSRDDVTGLVSIRIKTMRGYGCLKIEAVPPEEFLISRRAKDIKSAAFCAHRTFQTRAQLIAQGYKRSVVDGLAAYSRIDDTPEEAERWRDEDTVPENPPDESMDKIEVIEGYMEVDYDGDGLPEIVKATIAGGTGGVMLDHDLVACRPFASLCPNPMPHKYFGLSVADMVTDLQRIRTVLWRQLMDGTYFAANPQREVALNKMEKGGLDDVVNQKIGGIIRVKEIGAVREVQYPNIFPVVGPTLEYTDKIKQERTGVMPMSTGTDADALQNQSATAVNQMAAAASQRIELIARIFAETGVTDLFEGLLKLAINHVDEPEWLKVKNQWVSVNPSEWDDDMRVTCEVGLGHGNRDRSVNYLIQVLGIQQQAMAAGLPLVTFQNIYNTLEKITAWTGLGSVEPYFTDPATVPPQPPKPDPAMAKVQGHLALQDQKQKGEMAIKAQGQQMDAAHKERQQQIDAQIDGQELLMEGGLKLAEIAAKERAAHGANQVKAMNVNTNIKNPIH
jgi:hypothetical protein